MTRALLLENPHPIADEYYDANGISVTRIPRALDEEELIEALDGVEVLGIRSKTRVSQRVLEARPQLRAIGAYCIGTNQIDLEQATNQGIAVFNAPYSNTRSVVELVVSEMIALTRRIALRSAKMHAGLWNKSANDSHEVRGRVLGIVGYGSIGTQLSVLAEALGMSVIFYDIKEKLAMGNAKSMPSMDDVLRMADIVTIHVDGSAANAGLIGRRQFEMMKEGAVFLNLSRGFVVDIEALRDSLLSGHIAGAAVDVFPSEPNASGDQFQSPLVGIDNVILTPHVGGSTEEAQLDIGRYVTTKIGDYYRSGSTDMSVNLPNLTLHASPDARYRLAWIHRNTPGVLALVNQTFAEFGANINGQILGTTAGVGYAITDISSELPVEAIDAINGMPDTIRLRVLSR